MTRKLGEDRELTPLDFLLFGPSVTFLSARTSDGFAPVARALVPAFFVLFHLVIGFRIEQARHDARRRGRSRVAMWLLTAVLFNQDFLFGRPGTDRVADPRLRCNGFALLPRSVLLSLPLRPANFARSCRSGDRRGIFGNSSPAPTLGNRRTLALQAVGATLPAQVAPQAAPASGRTACGSDVPRPAATSSSEHASPAVRRSSSVGAASSSVKGGTKGGHWGGVKVDLLRKRLRLGKAAVSGAGTQSGDACEGGP